RAAVIRGQIVDSGGLGIPGVRVGVSTDPFLGFTMTRESGWFDLMINGGGSVPLHFHRDPFKSVQKVIMVPINKIVVLDKIVLTLDGQKSAPISEQFGSSGGNDGEQKKAPICFDHDYEKMKPIIVATWKQSFQNSYSIETTSILVESQIVQESIRIPGTGIHLLYHSSRSNGYLSTIELQLTPDKIEPTLRLVYLKISVEGLLFERTFEADPNILFTYAWNRRNVYRQKVYGLALATIHVGYQYNNCANIIWEVQTVELAGHDMPISEIGGWNIDVHHRYNFHEGILQKGDGSNVYLKKQSKLLTTSVGDGQQRPLHCSYCNGVGKDQRLLAPVALASGPDGSLYIGDFNLIRRLRSDGSIATVVELSESSVAYKYHLAVGSVDGKLYFSDPEKHQIFRVINLESPSDPRNNLEVFVGTGVKCLPGDRNACGDGRSATEAKLSYPKGIVVSPTGELYIADGTNIRMVDTFGIIHTLIGDHYHKSHWKPISCSGSTPINKLVLRWPTQLAISPLDKTLHILDDHMILKVTNDKRITIVAGRPSHCPSYNHQHHHRQSSINDSDDKKDSTDIKDPLATQVYLETPQAIAFSPNGDLFVAESDSQSINRVRVVSVLDQRISRFVGADMDCSCMEITCQCYSPDDLLAVNAHLSTISSIAVTPDGQVHISDQENLRIRTVYSPLPQPNPSTGEYEIVWPETQEVYVFNRHGQHIQTKSALTNTLIYSFAYNVNTINGKISSVTDAAGNKIYILRDYSNQVKSIENSLGDKFRLTMTRQGLLASFQTPSNYAIKFNYQGNLDALLASRSDSYGKSILYKYDENGRVIQIILPTGDSMKLKNRLAFDGTKKLTVSYNDQDLMRLDVSDRDVTLNQFQSDETSLQLERLGSSQSSSKGLSRKLSLRKRDTSHIEIESTSSPIIADSWHKMSELWPLPTTMRIVYNAENMKRIEWRYFVKRNAGTSTNSSNNGSTVKNRTKPPLTSIGRKLKLNSNIILSVEFEKDSNQQTVLDHSNRQILQISYDQVSRPIKFVSNHNLTSVAMEYDRFGRLSTWKRGHLSLQVDYDLKGRVLSVKHGDGALTEFKYADTTFGPTEIIKPGGVNRYLLQYDDHGGLAAITTPSGYRNELYRQISLGFYKLLFLPSGFHNPFTIQYDEWGRSITKLLPNNFGRQVTLYNSLGLLEFELCGQERTEYLYHSGSDLIKAINKIASENFDYKIELRHQGSLMKEERYRFNSRSELLNYKLRYKYDGFGHCNEIEFELQGRASETMRLKYSSTTGMEEGVDSFIFKRHNANIIQIGDERLLKTIATDSYGRLVGITFSVWNKELFSQVIHYEDRRSRISQSRIKYGSSYWHSNYSYQMDGSLESIVSNGSPTSSSPTQSLMVTKRSRFSYDIDGNLITMIENEKELKIRRDEAGRARNFGDQIDDLYMIDERGFTISRTSSNKFQWNPKGQLINVVVKSETGQQQDLLITYHYDHRDRLMSRFVSIHNGNNNNNSPKNILNRTQFVYDQIRPNLISYCIIDQRVIGFTYDQNNHLISMTIEGTKFYVASDHLGSPVAVYSTDGVLIKEIQRNVWGRILKDSNPSFWLPIDFQGSIRDPLLNLNHFDGDRVYDASIAQWLTPNWNHLSSKNLFDLVHLYRFRQNDPINPKDFVRKMDGDFGSLSMSTIESWLETYGYRMNHIFDAESYHQSSQRIDDRNHFDSIQNFLPIQTSLNIDTFLAQYNRISLMPSSKIKLPFDRIGKLDDTNQGFLSMHELAISTLPSPLSATLISRNQKETIVNAIEIEKNPLINSVLKNVLNDTYSLPFHLVHHHRDEFFFLQPKKYLDSQSSSSRDRIDYDFEQLTKLGSMINVTRNKESGSSSNSNSNGHNLASQLVINSGNLLLNIHYDQSFEDDLDRVIRIAHKKAIDEAWKRESYHLRHSMPGVMRFEWSNEEKKSLLHSGQVREYSGVEINNIERFPQLADDPTNLRFKRDPTNGSNLLNRKRRNHSHSRLKQRSLMDLFQMD
ncbi:teneurin-3-like protein, partial [Sarcoptes scabiei]